MKICFIFFTYAIRKYLDQKCLHVLVWSLVMSKSHFCNSLYASMPNYIPRKLQSDIYIWSARLIYSLPTRVPTTSYLIELYWLSVKARIEIKIICLLAFKVLKFGKPRYLGDLLNLKNVHAGLGLRTSDNLFLIVDVKNNIGAFCFSFLRKHFHILTFTF